MRWLLKLLNLKPLPKPDKSTVIDPWHGWKCNVRPVR